MTRIYVRLSHKSAFNLYAMGTHLFVVVEVIDTEEKKEKAEREGDHGVEN